MKSIKKIFSVLLCLAMCMTFVSMNAEASGNRDGEIVDGTLLTSKTSTMGIWEAKARGTYLQSAYSSIDGNNGNMSMYGQTLCSRICDTVEVNLYVERLVGQSWVAVTQRYATAYSSSSAVYSTSISVLRGYYYRVRGIHVATKGSARETITSYSESVYIN